MEGHFFSEQQARIKRLLLEGKPVIRLDVGSPDLPPSDKIIKVLENSAWDANNHGYQQHNGIRELREAWVEMYWNVHNVNLDPDLQVLPLIGSKEGIFHLSQLYINKGDFSVVPDPAYMTYERGTRFAGGLIHRMVLRVENGYLPILQDIPESVLANTRLLWLNYPNNPTGGVCGKEIFKSALELAEEFGFLVCHDAAYSRVTFDNKPAVSILEIPGADKYAVELNSLSKSHNMAGWRSGAIVGNEEVITDLLILKSNIDSGAFLPVSYASIQALTGNQTWLQERNEIYRQRRDVVHSYLVASGINATKPEAAIYIWAEVPNKQSSEQFSSSMLNDIFISVAPGTVFGRSGEGYFRISLTRPVSELIEAMKRIGDWVKQ
jgi:LL-diaminopimelate aminotransferase